MLEFITAKAGDRKLRLFGVACCKRLENVLPGQAIRKVVRLAELLAEGLLAEDDRHRAEELVRHAVERLDPLPQFRDDQAPDRRQLRSFAAASAGWYLLGVQVNAERVAHFAATAYGYDVLIHEGGESGSNDDRADNVLKNGREVEFAEQTHLLRDLFGNPFRSVAVDRATLSSSILGLAQTIYLYCVV
jgi:hypothetical protein